MSGLSLFLMVAVVFVATFSAIGTVYAAFRSRAAAQRAQVSRRLGTLGDGGGRIFKAEQKDRLADLLGSTGLRLRALVLESGGDGAVRPLVVRMLLLGAIGAAAGLRYLGPLGWVGLGAAAVPILVLKARARERSHQLSEQLPDALDLITRTLRAGHALSDALRTCAAEMPAPLSDELGRVYEEHHLGRDLRRALVHLAERNRSNFELSLLVSCLLLQRQTGGNLVELLDNIASTVRARFVFDAKVRALTAEARLSALILAALPFLLTFAILLMRPTYLAPLVSDALGIGLLAAAAAAFTTGLMLLRNISHVEV